MGREIRDPMAQNADDRAKLGSVPRKVAKHFERYLYEHAPRNSPAARSLWAQRSRERGGGRHEPPTATQLISAIQLANYSDLQGARLCPDDIYSIKIQARGWVHLYLAPSGARIELPIRLLLHRDTFRQAVWTQAHGVMLLPSEARWKQWIAARLAPFGIVINLHRPRPPRCCEAQEDEDEMEPGWP
jgi:hypothetical protein